ncbi:MAG TPA: hypothetical protein VGR00_03745, partial [Thermoanaerobaculia bacterium]|nr:hypothetical protein [Thermoanaerobaculia bacterium]
MGARSRTRRGSRGAGNAAKARAAEATAPRGMGAALKGLLVVGAVLFATTDERLFGTNPDGRVMFRTAVAAAELGELGIARGDADAMTQDRPGGDSISRYGLLPSFALVPAAALAAPLEKSVGPGASQFLFSLHQVLLLLLSAGGAGAFARGLGGDDRAVFRAGVATVLSSPLWPYASSDLTEPLQAALIAVAFAAATWAAREGTAPAQATRASILAGVAAGGALLTRSPLVLVLAAVLALLAANGTLAERR